MTTYTTILGDTWDIIALKTLGSEMYLSEIIKANIHYADVITFSAGVVLDIPERSPEIDGGLPPWKRGEV